MTAFFFATDSLLAFKTILLYCLGIYMILITKLIYQEPHPYWVSNQIHLKPLSCENKLDFACPSEALFNFQFIMGHLVFQYNYKYNVNPSKVIYKVVVALYIVFILGAQMMLMYYGWIYAYQSILSYLFTIVYLAVVIMFDDEIMQICENTGFKKQNSRPLKFQWLFGLILLYLIATFIMSGQKEIWVQKQDWFPFVVTDYRLNCNNPPVFKYFTSMGKTDTF